jgi:hypothetical protein
MVGSRVVRSCCVAVADETPDAVTISGTAQHLRVDATVAEPRRRFMYHPDATTMTREHAWMAPDMRLPRP